MVEASYRRPRAGLTTLNFLFASMVILLLCTIAVSTHVSGQQAQLRVEESLIASQVALRVADSLPQRDPGTYTYAALNRVPQLRQLDDPQVVVVISPYATGLRQVTVTVTWAAATTRLSRSRTITRLIADEVAR